MGAGKTTVARALAQQLSCALIDLDELITARTGRTPQMIIDEDGLMQFRQVETRALHVVLAEVTGSTPEARASVEESDQRGVLKPYVIISLGGGAWTMEDNRVLLAQYHALSVWLDAPFALCWHRLMTGMPHDAEHDKHLAGHDVRPLARDYEKARLLYHERRALYELARWRIEVHEGKSIAMLAAEIAALIAASEGHVADA